MSNLKTLINDISNSLVEIDSTGIPFRKYKPGVGPYGEPQLVRGIAAKLNAIPGYEKSVITKRTPDMIIKNDWALEFKIVRPFGDNGLEAENWSQNLLHPYEGNTSSLGDCLKLLSLDIPEKKAVVVIGYEHSPPVIPLAPLIESFELLATTVMQLKLGPRIEETRINLIHPIHQQLTVYSWEVLDRI